MYQIPSLCFCWHYFFLIYHRHTKAINTINIHPIEVCIHQGVCNSSSILILQKTISMEFISCDYWGFKINRSVLLTMMQMIWWTCLLWALCGDEQLSLLENHTNAHMLQTANCTLCLLSTQWSAWFIFSRSLNGSGRVRMEIRFEHCHVCSLWYATLTSACICMSWCLQTLRCTCPLENSKHWSKKYIRMNSQKSEACCLIRRLCCFITAVTDQSHPLSLPLQTVEHGFPHQPSALGYSPSLQLLAIGNRSGAIKLYPSL